MRIWRIDFELRKSSGKLISFLARVMPYAFLLAVCAVSLFVFALGRSDLAIKSLYLIVPFAAASALAVIKPRWFNAPETDSSLPIVKLNNSSFRHLALLFLLFYIVSLCFLTRIDARSPVYFVLVGAMASMILVEILACGKEHTTRKGVILLQIVFLSANLIFGETLRLPLFFGNGDVLPHMYNIETIVNTGHVTGEMLVNYQYFPEFHIFGAAANMLSGLDLKMSYFIFFGLIFITSIPIVYLLVARLTKNAHLPLLAALLYSINRDVIFGGMYMITRTTAFVLCFLMLYLLIKGRNNIKFRAIALFMVIPLVLLHHTTLLHFSGILLILIVLEYLLYRPSWHIGIHFLVLFVVAFLGYWFWIGYPFFRETLVNYSTAPDITRVPLQVIERPITLTFMNNLDAIVIAFLATMGVIGLLRARRELINPGTAFVLASLAALVVYFPGIASFFSQIFLTARLQLLVTPFIALVTAGGLWLVIRNTNISSQLRKSMVKICCGLCIVFFLAVSSNVILGNSLDLNLVKVLGSENRKYFIQSELTAFSFAYDHGEDIYYYSDYASSRYMGELLGAPVAHSADVFNPEAIRNGYMILREEELQTRGQLAFAFWGQAGTEDQEYVYLPGGEVDLRAEWDKEQKIYDDGTVYIYLKEINSGS